MDEKKLNQVVTKLLKKGIELQEIQKILVDEYNYSITFMNLRLLSADIEVNWSQFDPEKEEKEEKEQYIPPSVEILEVTKSSVVRPGAMMNGSFVAPSGSYGEWMVNSMGQLEVNYGNEDVPLSQEETTVFQEKLRELLTES